MLIASRQAGSIEGRLNQPEIYIRINIDQTERFTKFVCKGSVITQSDL